MFFTPHETIHNTAFLISASSTAQDSRLFLMADLTVSLDAKWMILLTKYEVCFAPGCSLWELWRGNMTPSYIRRLWGKEVWHASYQTTIVVGRISSGKRGRLSSTLSISTTDMDMGEPHSLLAMYSKSHAAQRTLRGKEKASPLNEPALGGMVSLVKRRPKEKTCPRGKRHLLILVLSEIRRVSFYKRTMETQ